jgi:hypothetical protein
VIIKDSKIIGSKTDIFVVYENSRNILLLNVTADPIHGDNHYIFNPLEASGIQNVTIMKGILKNSLDKTGPVISFHGVDRLNIRDNMIERIPNNFKAIDLSEVQNLLLCGNTIDQLNGTDRIFPRTC